MIQKVGKIVDVLKKWGGGGDTAATGGVGR